MAPPPVRHQQRRGTCRRWLRTRRFFRSATRICLARKTASRPQPTYSRAPIPPQPEYDLLWFIANYAPDLEGWERDIFLAVREESYYFFIQSLPARS
ncbi:SpoVR family protein [Undibacterium arcticum]